jgi:hypothetical protein
VSAASSSWARPAGAPSARPPDLAVASLGAAFRVAFGTSRGLGKPSGLLVILLVPPLSGRSEVGSAPLARRARARGLRPADGTSPTRPPRGSRSHRRRGRRRGLRLPSLRGVVGPPDRPPSPSNGALVFRAGRFPRDASPASWASRHTLGFWNADKTVAYGVVIARELPARKSEDRAARPNRRGRRAPRESSATPTQVGGRRR